jgi:NAD(P)-dependent dehydrogenase (short-subunit alcohol dehydrogenase family)
MKTSKFFKDKVVLITGASMGIGKDLAWQILQYGGKVIITGRNESRLLAVQDEFHIYSERLIIHNGDVANYENDVELIEKIILQFGRLDAVICNAGMSTDFGDLEITSDKVVEEIIDTNVKGSIFTSMAAIPKLKETKGSILFISSISAFQGQSGYALYSLSKMALTGLFQSLRIETKEAGIFVGIAYICFTKNETTKRILSHDGKLTSVPKRSELLSRPRALTAKIILNQISKRRPRVIHSIFGKFIYFCSKYMPFITYMLFERVYKNIKKSRAAG